MSIDAALGAALSSPVALALATVVAAKGSTPRHAGARMIVATDGTQWGTIGGGKIEQVVAHAAREVAGGAEPRAVHHHLVRDLAMCCGGAMTVAITPITDTTRAVLAELAALAAGTAGAIAARVLETPLGGGPLALRAPRTGDPRPHHPRVDGDVLVERVGAVERAIIFGHGHVARALGPLLAGLGFTVIACDDNDTDALAAAPTYAALVVESFDVAEVERALGGFTEDDHVMIVTRDHAIDQKLLEQLIGAIDRIGYVGMIGSRGKVGRFAKRLAARGLVDGDDGARRWAKLHAPIGLDLGAETPQEIAVAIAAELIARRRRGDARAGSWAPTHLHEGGDA